MMISSHSLCDLNKFLSRFFIVNSLAAMGILCGVVPEVAWHPSRLLFTPIAYSQEFSQTQISQYAQAILAIEVERKAAYQKIQNLLGRVPPQIACNQKDSLSKLPKEAQVIVVSFCNQSKKIAKTSGLNPADFNAITEAARKNPNLKKRIQTIIIQIRTSSKVP